MPNEETKIYTASLPVALLADLEECAADQHQSVNSILCSAAEDFIRAWRATQSQEHSEFIASLTKDAAPDVTADALADEEPQPKKARRQGQG